MPPGERLFVKHGRPGERRPCAVEASVRLLFAQWAPAVGSTHHDMWRRCGAPGGYLWGDELHGAKIPGETPPSQPVFLIWKRDLGRLQEPCRPSRHLRDRRVWLDAPSVGNSRPSGVDGRQVRPRYRPARSPCTLKVEGRPVSACLPCAPSGSCPVTRGPWRTGRDPHDAG